VLISGCILKAARRRVVADTLWPPRHQPLQIILVTASSQPRALRGQLSRFAAIASTLSLVQRQRWVSSGKYLRSGPLLFLFVSVRRAGRGRRRDRDADVDWTRATDRRAVH
jgi:hypothetical protein